MLLICHEFCAAGLPCLMGAEYARPDDLSMLRAANSFCKNLPTGFLQGAVA